MEYYRGCLILQPLATSIGIPIDQVNFVASEIFALGLSILFRLYLRPKDVGISTRHAIAGFVGLALGYFCFGRHILHMCAQAGICYIVMKFAPPHMMQALVLVFALLYLSVMHIKRMTYDYGGYALDVTGPLMISTQKVTSAAFSYHDGVYKKKEKLSPDQERHAIRKLPSLLEYVSYIFYFQGLLCGPLCFYNDYRDFIDGSNFKNAKKPANKETNNKEEDENPCPMRVVVEKLITAFVCLGITLFIMPYALKVTNADSDFIATHSFWYRFWFMLISVLFSRPKYYFAWKLSEAINNAAGLGFNGYTEDGDTKWDLVENVNIKKLETATSLKVLIENWNIQTAIWLRRLCYDRVKVQRTTFTYVLSALWHGFYPGYYLAFIGAAFFTPAARAIRRNVRPHFLANASLKMLYDVVTWFFAQLTLAYLIIPFTVLQFWPCFNFYTYSMYWWMHGAVGIVLLVLPGKPRESRSQQPKVTADKVTDDKVTADKVTDYKVTYDKITDDKVTDDKVTGDNVVSPGSLTTETINQQIPSEQPKDKDQ